MSDNVDISPNHPLVGTWITEEEDSDAAFTIQVEEGQFVVSGFGRSDGENFKVTDILWNAESLSFNAKMPSTGFTSKNIFRVRLMAK